MSHKMARGGRLSGLSSTSPMRPLQDTRQHIHMTERRFVASEHSQGDDRVGPVAPRPLKRRRRSTATPIDTRCRSDAVAAAVVPQHHHDDNDNHKASCVDGRAITEPSSTSLSPCSVLDVSQDNSTVQPTAPPLTSRTARSLTLTTTTTTTTTSSAARKSVPVSVDHLVSQLDNFSLTNLQQWRQRQQHRLQQQRQNATQDLATTNTATTTMSKGYPASTIRQRQQDAKHEMMRLMKHQGGT